MATTFSTGHFQAQNYDKYEMGNRNSVTYIPACSTLTPGSVYILFDYDPNDPAPTNVDEFADQELVKTCALYGTVTAKLENSQIDNCKFLVRTGPSMTDKLLTDPCAIHIGAFGYGMDAVTNGLTLGYFHIDYAAKLLVRQPMTTAVPPPRNLAMYLPTGGFAGTGVTDFILNDTGVDTIGVDNNAGTLSPPAGWYNVHSRAGLTVPATSPELNATFVSLEIRRNGVRVDQGQAVINRRFSQPEAVVLSSSIPVLVEEGDVLTQVLNHDSSGPITIIGDRGLFTLTLL